MFFVRCLSMLTILRRRSLGLSGDSDSSTGTWLANKVTSVQPLVLADVAKYIAANPHLFAGGGGGGGGDDAAASGTAVSTSSVPATASASASASASAIAASTDDERASARAFSAAAHATYASRLAALRPLLEREHAADSGRPFDAPREVRHFTLACHFRAAELRGRLEQTCRQTVKNTRSRALL